MWYSRFATLFSTRGEPFRLLLPLPSPLASTSPAEGLPGGLLEGSRCRCKRSTIPNRLNVSMYARLLLLFQNTGKNVPSCYPIAEKSPALTRGETGAGGLASCWVRNAKGTGASLRSNYISLREVVIRRYVECFARKSIVRGSNLFYEGFDVD